MPPVLDPSKGEPNASVHASDGSDRRTRSHLVALLLLTLTALAYAPITRAGWIWDDPDYVLNNPTLRSAAGLWRMWTDVWSLPQWYPLVHTTYWVEYRLWGLNPLGYHVTNVLLHALAATLLWRVTLRLGSGPLTATVAAVLFAVHPVGVESVAWVTERKNVLSMTLALTSLLAWLRARASSHPEAWLVVSFMLFTLALLAKTVVATLPAVMLVLVWWRRGRIDSRRDVLPLLPFFAVGVTLGLVTSHLERVHVGASGPEWDYARTAVGEFAHRTLIAGRAIAFYAGKLLWPHPLMFIYPRWEVSIHSAGQWVFPLAVIGTLIGLVLARQRVGRGPAAAALVYCGVLFPALGFANVFPHRYAFVADHFQYHASAAAFVAFAWAVSRTLPRRPGFAGVGVALLCVPLVGLTFARAFAYRDAETLWRTTVTQNPASWMAWTNLALSVATDDKDAALPYFDKALRLAPHVYDVQWNAGVAAMRRGQIDAAERHFREAVRLQPKFAPAYVSLGRLYRDHRDDPPQAAAFFGEAFRTQPYFASHVERFEYAALLARLERYADAAEWYGRGLSLAPRDADAWASFGWANLYLANVDLARDAFGRALSFDPDQPAARQGLDVLRQAGAL